MLLLVMPTGLQVGYDEYFSSSPLGLETIAAYARDYTDVGLVDLRGRGHDVEEQAELLLKQSPDMVGLSINSAPHTKYSLALAAAMKRRRPELKVLAGGQQATFLSEELLAPGDFDAVIRGEGEHAIGEILQRGGFAGVAGVSWRSNGHVVHEPERPLITDMDAIRSPARELLPNRARYRMGAYRVEGLESSRGCPHHCSFCSIRNFHRGQWRPRSVARVMQEIDGILARYPERKVIYFADDNFANNIDRVVGICKAIIERRSDAYFWCQARVDLLAAHPEVVEWMGKAHFAAVLAGIETPIPRLLKSARKGTNVQQIHRAIELLHQHDIGVWGTFTLGLPGETPEETGISADFVSQAGVDIAQVTVATPIPGSNLYDQAKADGSLLTHDWDKYDFTSPTMKGQLSKAEMDKHIKRAYRKAYVNWRFFRSLFSTRSNLSRLRRTALMVFATWILFVLADRAKSLLRLGRKRREKRGQEPLS